MTEIEIRQMKENLERLKADLHRVKEHAALIVKQAENEQFVADAALSALTEAMQEYRKNAALLQQAGAELSFSLENSSFSEIGIKRAMLTCADRRILLADHTKFGRRAIAKICDLEEFDLIITDEGLDPSAEAALEKKNIRLCKV